MTMERRHTVASISDISSKIWELEVKHDLFSLSIQGVKFWKLIRMPVFLRICEAFGLYETGMITPKVSRIGRITRILRTLYNSTLHGVNTRFKRTDILVVEHPRKIKVNGCYVNTHTESLVTELRTKQKNFEVVDMPQDDGRHLNPPDSSRSYFEHRSLGGTIRSQFSRHKSWTDEEAELVTDLIKLFSDKFDHNVISEHLILASINKFLQEKPVFISLLKRRKVKQVFLTCSYGFEYLIAACQETQVECVELQHGTMSRYHLGYSYPHEQFVPYFPDRLLLFGKFWADSTPLPLKALNIGYSGYGYLSALNKESYKRNPESPVVLFISQWTIGRQLSRIAVEFAANHPEYVIKYKLHPGEFEKWQTEYSELYDAAQKNQLEVIAGEVALHDVFKSSDNVVGVYSTAIYEALVFDCRIFLVNLPGIEYMEHLLTAGYADLVENADQLSDRIQVFQPTEIDPQYFFAEPSSIVTI